MSEPLVSVLMPVHDAERTLVPALESIRRQRGVRWECVAVDDGSRDGSLACLRRAAELDARIRVIAREHQGIVASLNAGLSECRGAYVARMDADDIMRRDRLRLQVAALEADPTLAAVGCHVRIFPRAHLREGRLAYEAWLNSLASPEQLRRDAFIECPLAHPTLMLRRQVAERYPYQTKSWPEDYDLILRLLCDGARIGVVPRKLLAWRDAPGRLSRVSPDYDIQRFTACKAHFLAHTLLAGSPEYVLWGYGKTGRSLAKALLVHGKRPAAIVEIHPGRVGQRIGGVRVIAPERLRDFVQKNPGCFIVASVARERPRAELRRTLEALGFVELLDYVCAA